MSLPKPSADAAVVITGASSGIGLVTARLAAAWGWRAGFAVPGLVCLASGIAFLALVPEDGGRQATAKSSDSVAADPDRAWLLALLFAIALIAGGIFGSVR